MFIIHEPPQPYKDPWGSSFEARFNDLCRASRRVAYFYETPDSSTFRYRVYNMISALRASADDVSAAYFSNSEIDRLPAVVEQADVLVICRARYTDKLNHAITYARNKGKRVFFDIDDLIFDPDYVHLVLDTLDQDLHHPDVWNHWFAYAARLGTTLRLCDAVITTGDYLASLVRIYANKPTHVIPNFLNREQLDVSRRLYEEKVRRGFDRTDRIYFGYFSGTPTHNKDFDIIASALVRALKEDPRIMIRIVGFMKPPTLLQSYASRLEFYGLHDFVNLQRLIALVEANLIPLQDNIFTNSKSELKYFEAGIVGTLSIASPVSAYIKAIRDGENGYLATNTDWFEKLMLMIHSMDKYPEMAEKAYREAWNKYAWHSQAPIIEQTLFPTPLSTRARRGQVPTEVVNDFETPTWRI